VTVATRPASTHDWTLRKQMLMWPPYGQTATLIYVTITPSLTIISRRGRQIFAVNYYACRNA
jgi:hypothetical protein